MGKRFLPAACILELGSRRWEKQLSQRPAPLPSPPGWRPPGLQGALGPSALAGETPSPRLGAEQDFTAPGALVAAQSHLSQPGSLSAQLQHPQHPQPGCFSWHAV